MTDISGGYLTFFLLTVLVSGISLGFVVALQKLRIKGKYLVIGGFVMAVVIFILMAILSTGGSSVT